MDSLLGIGTPELVLILLIAAIVLGPERMRSVARWVGRTAAQLQVMTAGLIRQLNAELDAADSGGEVKAAMGEVQDLRRQVNDLRRELLSLSAQPVDESQAAISESRAALDDALRLSVRETTMALQAAPAAKENDHEPSQ